MKQVEFELQGLKFRPKNMSPGEVLGLEAVVQLTDADKATTMFNTIMEKTEVEIAGVWVPLKEKGVEVYHPDNIKDDIHLLYDVCTTFMLTVIKPLFLKSGESK